MPARKGTRFGATLWDSQYRRLADGEVVPGPLNNVWVFWPQDSPQGPHVEAAAKIMHIGGGICYGLEKVVCHNGSQLLHFELHQSV